jgi:hypothetical protein
MLSGIPRRKKEVAERGGLSLEYGSSSYFSTQVHTLRAAL